MPGENRTKKAKKSGAQVAAQKTRGKKLKKKDARALRASNAVLAQYMSDLKEGEETTLALCHVVAPEGGGRFLVNNLVSHSQEVAKVAHLLSTRKAKHRNATLPTAVHPGSYVIVDVSTGTIRSVVGEARAAELRSLLHIAAPAEEVNEGWEFNRGVAARSAKARSSSGSKGSKGSRSSKGSKKAASVGGWFF